MYPSGVGERWKERKSTHSLVIDPKFLFYCDFIFVDVTSSACVLRLFGGRLKKTKTHAAIKRQMFLNNKKMRDFYLFHQWQEGRHANVNLFFYSWKFNRTIIKGFKLRARLLNICEIRWTMCRNSAKRLSDYATIYHLDRHNKYSRPVAPKLRGLHVSDKCHMNYKYLKKVVELQKDAMALHAQFCFVVSLNPTLFRSHGIEFSFFVLCWKLRKVCAICILRSRCGNGKLWCCAKSLHEVQKRGLESTASCLPK